MPTKAVKMDTALILVNIVTGLLFDILSGWLKITPWHVPLPQLQTTVCNFKCCASSLNAKFIFQFNTSIDKVTALLQTEVPSASKCCPLGGKATNCSVCVLLHTTGADFTFDSH
jgi:hypothetical protein